MLDLDILPPWKIRLTPKLGGEIVVAYADAVPAGFALLTYAVEPIQFGEPYLYLDMVGVVPASQGTKIGERLLTACVSIAAQRGLRSLKWTFDPLEGANANLYIRKLGAVGVAFYPNYYGELSGARHAGAPTDRLLVELRTDRCDARLASPTLTVSTAGSERLPARLPSCIRLVVPRTSAAPPRTDEWRHIRKRSAELLDALITDRGYVIFDFEVGSETNAYLLAAATGS